QSQLFDGYAAARVFVTSKRWTLQTHLTDIGWGQTIEDLGQGRQRRGGRITGKTEAVARPGGVAHELAWRERPISWESIRGQFPGLQNGVDVLIEPKPPLLDSFERCHGSDGFAHGSRLKHRVRVYWNVRRNICQSPAFRPMNFEILNDRNAEPGDVET